jgi:hypothetical protein
MQFAESSLPTDWEQICAKEDIELGSTWLKVAYELQNWIWRAGD